MTDSENTPPVSEAVTEIVITTQKTIYILSDGTGETAYNGRDMNFDNLIKTDITFDFIC